MSRPASFIARMGETATWTPRLLSVARDVITGWPDVYFGCGEGDFDPADFECDDFVCETLCVDIMIMVRPIVSREIDMAAGRVTEERLKMFTAAEVQHRDQILYHGDTYEVESEPIEHFWLGTEQFRDCTLVKVN